MKSKIDFVIAWVDGNDPKWIADRKKYENKENQNLEKNKWSNGEVRYRDWDNLQYWFRGIEKFAPWVNKIYFVTYGHLPSWLNTAHPKLKVVHHDEFIPMKYLPTFQSPTIECNLHRIAGISEKFVYFNDDMFIIKKTKPTDFFVKGMPCDSAILNMTASIRDATNYEETSAAIINDHFKKNDVIYSNIKKWFNIKYFPQIIRTLLLLKWSSFNSFYQHHLPSSFLKVTFNEVWSLEEDILNKTCVEKFRMPGRVSQYLFLDWQRVTGRFYPRSIRVGKCFQLGTLGATQYNQIEAACDYIRHQRGKMICLNDGELTNEKFLIEKELLQKAFESILANKSSYEK